MHTIRLRGPWELEPVERFFLRADGGYDRRPEDLPVPVRATMPADWGAAFGSNFFGRVRYMRTFRSPTGLNIGDKVWLVIEPARSEACVWLANELLGFVRAGETTQRFDVTDRLRPTNRLEVYVDHPALDEERSIVGDPTLLPPGGLVGEVRLEIEEKT